MSRCCIKYTPSTPLSGLIYEYCSNNPKSPSAGMRSLIKVGLKTGVIPVGEGHRLLTISTVNAVLENFKTLRFYDFDFIDKHQSKLLAEPAVPWESVEFLYRLAGLGHFNSEIVLSTCANILNADGMQVMSNDDKLKLLSSLVRLRIQVSKLAEAISSSCSNLSTEQNAKLCRLLAELGLLQPSIHEISNTPTGLMSSIDVACAICLYYTNGIRTDDLDKTLVESVSLVCHYIVQQEDVQKYLVRHPVMVRDIHTLGLVLQYVHRDLYAKLSENVLEVMAQVAYVGSAGFGEKCKPSNTKPVAQLGDILFKLKHAYTKSVNIGPYIADILERDSKVMWQWNGPTRYYSTSKRELTAYYQLQRMVLNGMGYTVIDIPYWHWNRMRNRKVRSEYCRSSRHISLTDGREKLIQPLMSCRDPTLFRINESPLLSAYTGSIIFKKEQPKKSWSWHSPIERATRVSL